MSVLKDFDEIYDHAHMWNWGPDWIIVKDIYIKFPDSYSVLTPFAYTYFEELIRSTTSEYGVPLLDTTRARAYGALRAILHFLVLPKTSSESRMRKPWSQTA